MGGAAKGKNANAIAAKSFTGRRSSALIPRIVFSIS
jgi:hypothetical protein